MEAPLYQLSFFSAWIFFFFCPSVLGLEAPGIDLDNTVFVAFTGEELHINCRLNIPANQTSDILTCFDPFHKQIYNCNVPETNEKININISLKLKRLKSSGEYACRYKTAEVFWFLHVRDGGYQDRVMFDYSEFIIVAIFSGVLLVFSIVGSTFVLRGYWKECKKKKKPNKEERNDTQTTQSNVDIIPAPSMSFYASLETRPRSIYDVLDHSATNTVPDESGGNPKNNKPKNKVVQTVQNQQEDESVYENF